MHHFGRRLSPGVQDFRQSRQYMGMVPRQGAAVPDVTILAGNSPSMQFVDQHNGENTSPIYLLPSLLHLPSTCSFLGI